MALAPPNVGLMSWGEARTWPARGQFVDETCFVKHASRSANKKPHAETNLRAAEVP